MPALSSRRQEDADGFAPTVVGLEIGTTKTVALVGEMREDGNMMITGIGEHQSTGVRKGEIIDLENALCVLEPLCRPPKKAAR